MCETHLLFFPSANTCPPSCPHLPACPPAPTRSQWKKTLRVRLPPYMVPSIFEPIADIPTLPSGKADRKKLPPPKPAAETAGGGDEGMRVCGRGRVGSAIIIIG